MKTPSLKKPSDTIGGSCGNPRHPSLPRTSNRVTHYALTALLLPHHQADPLVEGAAIRLLLVVQALHTIPLVPALELRPSELGDQAIADIPNHGPAVGHVLLCISMADSTPLMVQLLMMSW